MNTVFNKIGLIILLLFLTILIPLGIVIHEIFQTTKDKHLREETHELATQQAYHLNMMEEESWLEIGESLSEEYSREIVIIGSSGQIVVNSGVNNFEEYVSQDLTSEGTYTTPDDQSFYFSSRKVGDGNSVATVYVFSPLDLMKESTRDMRNALILSGIIAIILTIGLTWVIARNFTKPLRRMDEAAKKMAKGKLDVTLPVRSNDEIGTLSDSINELAKEIRHYRMTRNEFLSNVSHELRTPISYTLGYSQALLSGLFETEEQRRSYLNIIHQEANRMNFLVRDLIELAQMDENKYALELSFVDSIEIAEKAIEKVSLQAEEKQVHIHTNFPKKVPKIVADPIRLEQIFLNILQNAIQYMDKGGEINFTIDNDSDSLVHTIEDTGPGISENNLPHLFDRFYRVEKSRSREHGGSGLGLAISKQLTELQYGEIDVSSELGKGTSFVITFPQVNESSKG
ncbi:two-component sensor histidine kinase [Halalkalibacillus sediminis]|uniref:histidine kinase n=1 Tax=Halalkalibacillus sediminis TaxID=2018042 RepID=A0A2I0QTH1_9BACI|nr:HAMP domain-containing sensor histidine kinase [Halalkalibacillus sediminis]PKR77626.1 two-component sensor histidine kinase [Halalkalibacillus sediminis]